MPARAVALILVLMIAPLAVAADLAAPPPAARIDMSFPPPDDRRRPDSTVDQVPGGPVTALAFSADGRTLATAGQDGQVRLWNARPGKGAGTLLRTLAGEGKPRPGRELMALGFSADNLSLRGLGRDHRGWQWELASGKLAGATAGKLRLAAATFAVIGGKDALVAAPVGKDIVVLDAASGEVTRTLAAGGPAAALAVGGEGALLAVVAAPPRGHRPGAPVTVRLHDLAGGTPPRSLELPGPITALAVNKKGDALATAGGDGGIRVWEVSTAALLATQEGHRGQVLAVGFNPNGQKMTSSGRDGSLRSWTVPLPPLPADDLAKIEAAVPERATAPAGRTRRLLVFWRADAILHKAGVPAVNHALALMGKKTGAFEAHFSRDYEVFDPVVLARYDGIVLNSTAHLNLPDESKKKALLDYVRGGGAVVGIHAAIDMFKDWPEGAAVVGATFAGHPWGPSGSWAVKLEAPGHPLLRAWAGRGFKMKDEFYELGEPYTRGDRQVLLSLDMTDPATSGVTPLHRIDRDFAVSWTKSYGKGRVFYCMFGHVAGPFHDPRVQRYYLDGIQWALGDLRVEGARASR